jgi:hypothetical protein
MQDIRTADQEAAEDIFFGQLVIIWARWFLIFAGIVLTLWTVDNPRDLTFGLVPIIALMLVNFYLHGRYVLEKPANQMLVAIGSVIDLIIVTVIVLIWPGETGLESPYSIFYYPIILAFAFVFRDRYTLFYTGAALIAYTASCLALSPDILQDTVRIELLLQRLIIMAAIGGLGTFYWRIQRKRRRAAESGQIAR